MVQSSIFSMICVTPTLLAALIDAHGRTCWPVAHNRLILFCDATNVMPVVDQDEGGLPRRPERERRASTRSVSVPEVRLAEVRISVFKDCASIRPQTASSPPW